MSDHDDQPQAEEGEGNWLISYADLMTLLMAFFAIMFTFSSVDQKKFEEVKKSVTEEFGGKIIMPFESISVPLQELIKKRDLGDKVQLEETSTSLSLIFQGSILFDSGSTELIPEARETISDVIDILREEALNYPIVVEGHTDDVPISSEAFPSNWELSSARASLILRMLEMKGFDRTKLQAQGFADTRPLLPHRDPATGAPLYENRAMNRRITIRVIHPASL